ncbi:Ras GTPase activating protein ira2 [Chytriomyces hyalinus]|nr:Ras GTPase activating protein ira2 [Chytriomyces hyalinus]
MGRNRVEDRNQNISDPIHLLLENNAVLLLGICHVPFVGEKASIVATGVLALLENCVDNTASNGSPISCTEIFLRRLLAIKVLQFDERDKDQNDILRDNSLTTLLLTSYIRQKGEPFLKQIVTPKLESLFPILDHCEMDPAKLQSTENDAKTTELQTNQQNLVRVCQCLLDTVFQNMDQIPDSVRRLCRFLKEAIEQPANLSIALKPTSTATATYDGRGASDVSLLADHTHRDEQPSLCSTPQKRSGPGSIHTPSQAVDHASTRRGGNSCCASLREKFWNCKSFNTSSSSFETTASHKAAYFPHLVRNRNRRSSSSRNCMYFDGRSQMDCGSEVSSVRSNSTNVSPNISKATVMLETGVGDVLLPVRMDSCGLSASSSSSRGSDWSTSKCSPTPAIIQKRFWQVFGGEKRSSVSPANTPALEDLNGKKDGYGSAVSLDRDKFAASSSGVQLVSPPETAINSENSLFDALTRTNAGQLGLMRSGPEKLARGAQPKTADEEKRSDSLDPLAHSSELRININIISATPLDDTAFLHAQGNDSADLVYARPSLADSTAVLSESDDDGTSVRGCSAKRNTHKIVSRHSSLRHRHSHRPSVSSMQDSFENDAKLCLHEKVIGSLLFLRFLVPFIITPASAPMSPHHRRGLILVGKVLTASSNGVEFGAKEDFLMPLNCLLKTNRTRIKEFVDSLVSSKHSRHSILSSEAASDDGNDSTFSNLPKALSSSMFSLRDPQIFSKSANTVKSKTSSKSGFLRKSVTLGTKKPFERNSIAISPPLHRKFSSATLLLNEEPSLKTESSSQTKSSSKWGRRQSTPLPYVPSRKNGGEEEVKEKRVSLPTVKIFQHLPAIGRKSVFSLSDPAARILPMKSDTRSKQYLEVTKPALVKFLKVVSDEMAGIQVEVEAAIAAARDGTGPKRVSSWLQEDPESLSASFGGLQSWCLKRYPGTDEGKRKSSESRHANQGAFMKKLGAWIGGNREALVS